MVIDDHCGLHHHGYFFDRLRRRGSSINWGWNLIWVNPLMMMIMRQKRRLKKPVDKNPICYYCSFHSSQKIWKSPGEKYTLSWKQIFLGNIKKVPGINTTVLFHEFFGMPFVKLRPVVYKFRKLSVAYTFF